MNVQVKIGDQSFIVEIGDLSARPVLAKVDGETFEVWPVEESAPIAQAVEIAAPAAVAAQPAVIATRGPTPASSPVPAAGSSRVLVAPLPGVIVEIAVRPGDAVTRGQEIIALEAMKMKNAIRAPQDASIAAVLVSIGDHVQKGQPLIEFTD